MSIISNEKWFHLMQISTNCYSHVSHLLLKGGTTCFCFHVKTATSGGAHFLAIGIHTVRTLHPVIDTYT